MASQASIDLTQLMYVAYYGRPGDQGGIDYWAGVFDASSDLNGALSAFGTSPEFLAGFGTLSTEALIDGLYQQLFNRDADPAGRAWYADLITSGQSTLARIAMDIALGAQGEDETIVANKILVANGFNAQAASAAFEYTSADIPAARKLLTQVTETTESVTQAEQYAQEVVSNTTTPISIHFSDTSGVMGQYQNEIEAAIRSAWAEWDQYLAGHRDASIEINVVSTDSTTDLALAKSVVGTTIGETFNGKSVVQDIVGYELIHGIDENGTDFDGQITISTYFLSQEGYYDFSTDGSVTADQFSFQTVMTHEIGHMLGFSALLTNSSYTTTFQTLVSSQDRFIGEHAQVIYGGEIPLDSASVVHLSESAFNGYLMSPEPERGQDSTISTLELAMAEDIGLPVLDLWLV